MLHRLARLHKPDYLFAVVLLLLVVFGLVLLSSASAPTAIARFDDAYFFVKRQVLFGVLPGLALFLVIASVDYRLLKRYYFIFFLLSLLLLILVFIPGLRASFGTARSWIEVGNFSMQPSEVVKLLFIIFLAAWFDASAPEKITDIKKGIMPFVMFVGIILALLMLQPDMGTFALFGVVSFCMAFLAGARLTHLAVLGGVGIAGLGALIVSAPYRVARFMTFLHPELDPQGVGYHINQALLAIGSGGFWGLGFGHSRQKFQYLPEVISDSIFAVYAEEFGFISAVLLILAFIWIMRRGFKIASLAPDRFGSLLVYGIMVWFGFQAFFNIAAMVGLMPLTGLPLPFVSHGGTALMTALAGAGLVVSVSRQTRK
ncbi:MAG TPA: putative lipid II flippase FtsW [Candidatus Magasanikbacteria bacterium]|nr:putative lipid II flippase FtsW [Candidatus Magasanikbacteria bacterium]